MQLKTLLNQKFQDSGAREQRFFRLITLMTLDGAFNSFVLAVILWVMGLPPQYVAYGFCLAFVNVSLYLACKSGQVKICFFGLVFITSLSGLMGTVLYGWKSGFYVHLFVVIPIMLFNPAVVKAYKGAIITLFSMIMVTAVLISFLVQPLVEIDPQTQLILNSANILLTGLAIGGISYLDFRNSNEISDRLTQANEKLQYLASRDPLTNLLNRRTMNDLIEKEHARSKRSGKPFGLIMADVDDFKVVNDEHGHAAGDLVLTQLATALSSTLRAQDTISRWGGEEFLILLPETDFPGMQVTAKKLHDIVSHSNFNYQGKPIQITLSFGTVICENHEESDDSIKHADRALYYGKRNGKNQTIFSNGRTFQVLYDPRGKT
jgi:diguanylate cyclase (GGDEF)-like protein